MTVRATLYSLSLACLLIQGLPQPARAALGGSADSIESDRIRMKGLTRPIPAGSVQKQELQLPSGTVVTEYLTDTKIVFAVTWRGPALPDLHQVLGDYFANYQTAASQPAVRRRLVRVSRPDIVIESGGKMRAFTGRAWVPALLPSGVTSADIQ
ncbi:MAG: DUF2844 domain-containing protein [Steroidobacteraceae bacterium]